MQLHNVQKIIHERKNLGTAKNTQRFFGSDQLEQSHAAQFLGIRVPELRLLSKQFSSLSFSDLSTLLKSAYHEERLLALFILILRYKKASTQLRNEIYTFYIEHVDWINNWALVDSSAPYIVGQHLVAQDKKQLYTWAQSPILWHRRIAMVATQYFIRKNQFQDTLDLAKTFLHDQEDLMHKAVGWMLREVGERDIAALESFLKQHYNHMPRTMLRYAIEKFPEHKRKAYLLGTIEQRNI